MFELTIVYMNADQWKERGKMMERMFEEWRIIDKREGWTQVIQDWYAGVMLIIKGEKSGWVPYAVNEELKVMMVQMPRSLKDKLTKQEEKRTLD